ncbi:putative protein [Pseudoclavibacter triregionum]|nr:putative protein [Pseudoclavibacter triregionum]
MTLPAEIDAPAAPEAARLDALAEELSSAGLHLERDARRKAEYAYDASIYRVPPLGVVYPKTAPDLVAIARACTRHEVPIVPRAGGTSLAGNSIGPGVVVDVSRYLRGIGAPDEQSRTIRAEGGVILSVLKSTVERETEGRLTFAPDPSSFTRVCLAGAIGNDACGNHSVKYGRISDSIVSIELVTSDGAHLLATRGGITAVDPKDSASVTRAAQLDRELRALVDRNLARFRTGLETIPRQVSGYHLAKLLPERGFDVAKALAGSEGGTALIVAATMELVPRAKVAGLTVLGYPDPVTMARDVPAILELGPSAVEGIDVSIVEAMKVRRGPASVSAMPEGSAFLWVEFECESEEEAVARSEELLARLRRPGADGSAPRLIEGRTVSDPNEKTVLWRIREDGAGLASRPLGEPAGFAGWEDSAVAPERLGDYLRDLRELMDAHGYRGAMYGHFGAGCMHIRIDFDLRTKEGIARFRAFMEDAARLVVRHGGSLSGEHGDGRARGELLSIMYDEGMLAAFREFKAIWDPKGLLNPGVGVDPDPIDAHLALDGVPNREWRPALDVRQHGGSLKPEGLDEFIHTAQACVGVGRCRTVSGTFMCPSYRATGDEKDSTRGRSRVLQEMLRGARTVEEGWKSPEVREALDLCLSCKACASDCPTGVDMASLKSAFQNEYYKGRVRPRSHYTVGRLPMFLPLAQALAPVANLAMTSPLKHLVFAMSGVTSKRPFPTFARRAATRDAIRAARLRRHGDRAAAATDAVLFLDSFTKAFRPELIEPASRVLGDMGQTASCEAEECCGLTWISTGQLDGAKRRMRSLVEKLDDGTERPIVMLEPSCAAAVKHDAPKLLPDDPAAARVASRVRSFADYARERLAGGWRPTARAPAEVALQPHCHEYSAFGHATQRQVYEAWGAETITQSTSCCGLAGNFGIEAEHYDTSMKVAEHSMGRMLSQASPCASVATDGFSCVTQLAHLDAERKGQHLVQLMDPERAKEAGGASASLET